MERSLAQALMKSMERMSEALLRMTKSVHAQRAVAQVGSQRFKETDPFRPGNPYSASKASFFYFLLSWDSFTSPFLI